MPRSLPAGRSRIPFLAPPVLVAVLLAAASPARALEVATWNLIDYPNLNPTGRAPHIRTAMLALDPDVIILQELKAGGRDSFLVNILGLIQPGQWAAGTYIDVAESCVFYKPSKVNLTFAGSAIATGGPRQVLGVRIKFPGYVSREAEMLIYSVHFKAGNTAPDSMERRLECTSLRNSINANNPALVTRHFLVGGDTNFYGTWEGGYARLTESQADNDGRCFDPLNLPGTWNSGGYAAHHTQSTCNTPDCPGFWSSGGLDDRFDLFLTSSSVQDGEGLDLVPGSYVPFGNDGLHHNGSVNGGGFNNAVGLTVATALLNSSDHLPVMVTIQAPARVAAASQLDFGRVIVGASAAADLMLSVSNPATLPADELTYTLVAPAGFTAPGGGFQALAGAGANAHAISIDTTTPAVRTGTLTVACDDPDSTGKSVFLSGSVLAHAVPSLDSLEIALSDTVDFGAHPAGEFTDMAARVHNVGWNSQQSKLELLSGAISGGAGRFSIVGGFSPSQIAGTGSTTSLRFDGDGATADSTYEATLTFSGSDEALPGQAASPTLTLLLRASVSGGVTGVPFQRPDRMAFLPPHPNPFRHDVEFGFDLSRDGNVSLVTFDLTGRRVAGIFEGPKPAGSHTVRWRPVDDSGAPLRAGLYLVRFQAPGFSGTRRIVLLP